MTDDEQNEAAIIIADLVGNMNQWQHDNLNCVRVAVVWLKKHDRPGRWLRTSVRDLMEAYDG